MGETASFTKEGFPPYEISFPYFGNQYNNQGKIPFSYNAENFGDTDRSPSFNMSAVAVSQISIVIKGYE